jgi:hypothetical protein
MYIWGSRYRHETTLQPNQHKASDIVLLELTHQINHTIVPIILYCGNPKGAVDPVVILSSQRYDPTDKFICIYLFFVVIPVSANTNDL